jgi:hypothetical protein
MTKIASILIVCLFFLTIIPLTTNVKADSFIHTITYSNWDVDVYTGTVGISLREVKWNNHFLFRAINVPYFIADDTTCGLYDLSTSRYSFNPSPNNYGYVYDEYTYTNVGCSGGITIPTVKVSYYWYNNGEIQTFVYYSSATARKVYARIYYDPALSSDTNPVDNNYAYLDHGQFNSDITAYDSPYYHHETYSLMDKAHGASRAHSILITNDGVTQAHKLQITNKPNYNDDWDDYVPIYVWVTKCTACSFSSSSQYTNGPGSYANHEDIQGGKDIHIIYDIRMTSTATTHDFASLTKLVY